SRGGRDEPTSPRRHATLWWRGGGLHAAGSSAARAWGGVVGCARRAGWSTQFTENGLDEPQGGRTVWQGRIGDVPLRVDMLPSGRIFATWSVRGNDRRAVLDTIQQLEQRVLFQLMLGAGPQEDVVARQVVTAVQAGKEGLPA